MKFFQTLFNIFMFVMIVAMSKFYVRQHDWNAKMMVYGNFSTASEGCITKSRYKMPDGKVVKSETSPDKKNPWYTGYCATEQIWKGKYMNMKKAFIEKYGNDDYDSDKSLKEQNGF